jgi:hypothetical protein
MLWNREARVYLKKGCREWAAIQVESLQTMLYHMTIGKEGNCEWYLRMQDSGGGSATHTKVGKGFVCCMGGRTCICCMGGLGFL